MYLEAREMCFRQWMQSISRLVKRETSDMLLPGSMVTPRERESWQESHPFGGQPWLWR